VLSVSLRLGGKELFTAEAQKYAERRREVKLRHQLFNNDLVLLTPYGVL
jgi:hypothetical protein